MGNPLKVTLCSKVRCLWFEADTIHMSTQCQWSDGLKIHLQQLPMRYDTIHTKITTQIQHCDSTLWFNTVWFNAMWFNIIWFNWTAQRNDAPQVNETDFLLINGLSNKSSTCKSNLGGLKILNYLGGHISKQMYKTSYDHIDRILPVQTFNNQWISISVQNCIHSQLLYWFTRILTAHVQVLVQSG